MRVLTYHCEVVDDRTADDCEPYSMHSIESRDVAARIVTVSEGRNAGRWLRVQNRAMVAAEADAVDEAALRLSDAIALEDEARDQVGAVYDEAFDGFAHYDADADQWHRPPITPGRLSEQPARADLPTPAASAYASAFRIPQAIADGDPGQLPEWAWRPWFKDPRRAMRRGFKTAWQDHPNVRLVALDANDVMRDEAQPDRFASDVPLAHEVRMASSVDGYVVALAQAEALKYRVLRGMVEFGPPRRPNPPTHTIAGHRASYREGYTDLDRHGYQVRKRAVIWRVPEQRNIRPASFDVLAGKRGPARSVLAYIDRRDRPSTPERPYARSFDPDGTSVSPDSGWVRVTYAGPATDERIAWMRSTHQHRRLSRRNRLVFDWSWIGHYLPRNWQAPVLDPTDLDMGLATF